MPILMYLLGHWRLVGALLIVLALAGYIETLRLERDHAYSQETKAKAELATFKAEVAALGEQAKKQADAKEAADKQRKESADAENSAALATLAGTIKRLRDARSSSSFVPTAASSASRPELACFDRILLDGALRALDQDLQGIADEGSKTTVDLDTAKRWAQH